MLLFLLAGAAIAILAASYYYFRSTATPPASATQPAAAPATRPAASAPTAHTRASAPATRTGQWVRGLRALRTDMYDAMGSGAPTTVTAASLRSAARKFSRCPAELAALGPPPGQLRQAYRQANQACSHFKRGAACYAAAARAFSYSPAANTPGAKFPRLLGCGDAAVNKGATLIALATSDASFLQTPD
jgi:hypothetical protein